MNFNNIEYFIAIVEERNISRAAERLHITQQTLSEHLKKLESEVGAVLINRGQPMTLTDAGEVFLRKGNELLLSYQEMLDEISFCTQKEQLRIRVAIPVTETPPYLPELLTRFAKEYPDMDVRIVKVEPKEAAKRSSDYDLYFSTLPLGNDLENVIIKEDEYAVVLSSVLASRIYGDHWQEIDEQLRLYGDLYVLRDLPFIFLTNRIDETVLDQQIIFSDAGFTPEVAFQSENSELNCNMCKLGAGAYVTTMEYCNRFFGDSLNKNDGMLLYPIRTSIDPVAIALSHRKGMRLNRADRCFIETARDFLN